MRDPADAIKPVHFKSLNPALQQRFVDLFLLDERNELIQSSKWFEHVVPVKPVRGIAISGNPLTGYKVECIKSSRARSELSGADAVINVKNELQLKNMGCRALSACSRRFAFNHKILKVDRCQMTLEDLKLASPASLLRVNIAFLEMQTSTRLDIVLNHFPSVQELEMVFQEYPENWERRLRDSNLAALRYVYLQFDESPSSFDAVFSEPSVLKQFVSRQPPNFYLVLDFQEMEDIVSPDSSGHAFLRHFRFAPVDGVRSVLAIRQKSHYFFQNFCLVTDN